jgi:hypothetical protein
MSEVGMKRIMCAMFAAFVFFGCGEKAAEIRPVVDGRQGLSAPVAQQRFGEFVSATSTYGPLVVRDGEFEASSVVRPWSAWWMPVRDTYLFKRDGQLSPLEKYDQYIKVVYGKDPAAAAFERDNLFDSTAGGWEGLCDAWAAASLLEPEPMRPFSFGRMVFGVGDLKALLVKSYEEVGGLVKFGQRYNGDRKSVYDDVYPDQFHKFVQAELFENGRPFIMDKDPGVAVWNTPVWYAAMKIERDANDSRIMHVTTWLRGASPLVPDYDYVGTLSVAFEYTYDLFGIPQADGSFAVEYGEWTGASQDYHPDFLTSLPSRTGRSSRNTKLDIKLVDELLAKSR